MGLGTNSRARLLARTSSVVRIPNDLQVVANLPSPTKQKLLFKREFLFCLRRGRDSNPRYLLRYTHFPGGRTRPTMRPLQMLPYCTGKIPFWQPQHLPNYNQYGTILADPTTNIVQISAQGGSQCPYKTPFGTRLQYAKQIS